MKPVITLKEYETIFRVLYAVSHSVGNTTGKACLFYNVIGALVLAERFKKKARPVMGAAFFRVHDPSATVLSYSRLIDGIPSSDAEAFHCWVECEGFLIDFTAPVFRESFAESGQQLAINRQMLQKPLSQMASTVNDLSSEGDFWLLPNPELSNELLAKFLQKPAPSDLAKVCLSWVAKPSKKTPEVFAMMNDLGEVSNMKLPNIHLVSAW